MGICLRDIVVFAAGTVFGYLLVIVGSRGFNRKRGEEDVAEALRRKRGG